MTLSDCYNCKYADEYMAYWWYPKYDPSCSLGNQMDIDNECECFEQIGRLSR